MRKLSRVEREALSEWRAEMALYAQGEITAAAREHLKWLMERTLETEITQRLGATRYARSASRTDWRNGHRSRDLVTEMGLLVGLRVPRSRKGSYQPQVFERYGRRARLVNRLIVEMFVAGVSTRRVGEVLEALLGDSPSATTVSRVAKSLDARARQFHMRPVKDRWRFLVLDGVYMSVKGACGLRKRVVLVAYGIDVEGRRELLDFQLANGESEPEWSAFLESLWRRGLHGNYLEMAVMDGAPGLAAALQLVYPYAQRQRCWVHKLRNVSNKVRKGDRDEVIKGARAIYLASTRRAAIKAFRRWKKRWEPCYPKAVDCLEKDLDALLCCMDYPIHQRSKLRTTNAIERAFVEVRRRTRPMSAFTNDASCERITYALVAHLNAQWSPKPLPEFTHNS
jgi:putative transposase